MDPSSLANLKAFSTKEIQLEWFIDFEHERIIGSCLLELQRHSDTGSLFLDTRRLKIHSVKTTEDKDLTFHLHETTVLGQRLEIDVSSLKSETIQIKIFYETISKSQEPSALQFLTKEQTGSKKFPFLLTQCQAIHCRSLMPCQDSPSKKFRWKASVIVPKGMTALMSGIGTKKETYEQKSNWWKTYQEKTPELASKEGFPVSQAELEKFNVKLKPEDFQIFYFEQPELTPSYLLALAVGYLEKRELSHRTCVWTEPEIIDQAANAFKDVEKYLLEAEKLVHAYEWHRYDFLVLPPSFPYGGMENPCLTFLTPTLLPSRHYQLKDNEAIDTSVLIHELMHSWAGNSVTVSSWEHFWLNEGFCVYLEGKMIKKIFGNEDFQLKSIIGWKHLEDAIKVFKEWDSPNGRSEPGRKGFSSLVVDLQGKDPDDAFSSVPYEKGSNFLFFLDRLLGLEKFEKYIKAHFQHFKHSSLNTEQWKTFLYQHFDNDQEALKILNEKVDWQLWLETRGMPPIEPPFDQSVISIVHQLAERWNKARNEKQHSFTKKDLDSLSLQQKVIFLDKMSEYEPLPDPLYQHFKDLYLDQLPLANYEIRMSWLSFCLKAKDQTVFKDVELFLSEQGRMKYLRPIYRALNACCKEGKEKAKEIFKKNQSFYHPIAASLISKDIF